MQDETVGDFRERFRGIVNKVTPVTPEVAAQWKSVDWHAAANGVDSRIHLWKDVGYITDDIILQDKGPRDLHILTD